VLLFRMARDYLFTLLLPFVFLVLGLRPIRFGLEEFFRNFPDTNYSGQFARAAIAAWFLMSLAWITITYAISLFINRSDKNSTRNKRILGWGIALLVGVTFLHIGLSIAEMKGTREVLALAQSPILRIVFFTGSLASQMTIAPLSGDFWSFALGLGGLLSIIGGSLWVAMSQADWMYDQAAVRGFESSTVRAAQRKGDTMGAMAELARRGKIKAGRRTFIHRLKMPGAWSLLWKEYFLQTRGMMGMLVMLGLMGIGFCILPSLIPERESEMGIAPFFFLMQAVALFMITLAISQTGFIEVLRRVDLQRPLPFSSSTIVFFEIAGKALLGIVVAVVAAVVAGIINPSLLPHVIAALIYSPALSLLLSATVFMVTIMFPDIDDPTQRQFRGLMMLLGLAVLGLPPTAAFLGLLALSVPSWIAAIAGAVICVGMSALAAVVGGKLYEGFNPSE
jgi:hypothetical protein